MTCCGKVYNLLTKNTISMDWDNLIIPKELFFVKARVNFHRISLVFCKKIFYLTQITLKLNPSYRPQNS
jgi:hypothetical protein